MEGNLDELRAPARAARALVAAHPAMAEIHTSDRREEALFYARFGVRETQFLAGVPANLVSADALTGGPRFRTGDSG